MTDIKKAIPTKAGTAHFNNVATTFETDFSINKSIRTENHTEITGNNFISFGIKGVNKIGIPFVDAVTRCNLRTVRGL
jgi:hypothetical protein